MSRKNEKVTTTLERLATLMVIVAAKYTGEDSAWALKNWELFLPAAEEFKDRLASNVNSDVENAAIDFMQGLDNSGFANEFGGIGKLKDKLRDAIDEHQS